MNAPAERKYNGGMSELPDSTRPRAQRKPLSRTERFLIAYAVLGGAAWTAVFFDGTMAGFVNGVIAFLVVGFALTYVASRLDDKAHERARFPGESEASSVPRAEREGPPVSPGHLWSRRAAIAMFFAGLTGAVIHRVALERKQLDPEFFLAVLVMAIAVFAIIRLDRKALIAADEWRAERRAARTPDAPKPGPGTPLHVHEIESTVAFPERPHAKLQAQLEKLLIVFAVLGLPFSALFFGGPGGLVFYTGLIVVWLGLLNRLDSWSSPGLRISNNEAEQRRAHERIRLSRGPWSANPPRQLKYMRIAFLVLVVLGGIVCIVMPFLDGDSPAERYRMAVPFVGGFLISLGVLAIAEREQNLRERLWLEGRQAERERVKAHS